MKVCLIDNYDSFTYNVEHLLKTQDVQVEVIRNDQISVDELDLSNYDAFVLGPGPSNPSNAGICNDLIKYFYKVKPILGICLGHQCIGYSFNSKIIRTKNIMHGKTSMISHNKQTIFKGLKVPYHVMRYHSLIIDSSTLHKDFEIIASVQENSEEIIMAIKHNKYNLFGVQFHPESIFSEQGNKIIANFLEIVNEQ